MDETDTDEFIFILGSNTGFKREKNFSDLFKSWSDFRSNVFYRRNKKTEFDSLSFLPGLIFLFVAKISREKIGVGDGWLFLIVASWLGSKETWALWQMSLILSSIFSLVMLITKKYSSSYCIAFIPFVWLSHLLLWSLYYGK